MNVVIGDEDPLGSFVFRTTGFNSTRTLTARLHYFQAISGNRLACLALELRLRGKSTRQSHGSKRSANLCARKWRDDQKRPWLDTVPMITKLNEKKASRKPYPISWDEQSALFAELPDHLQRMALYKVNTGCREKSGVKNGEDRLVVLNDVAKRVIDGQRGMHPVWVFPYGQPDDYGPTPVHRMNDSAWKKARVRAAAKWEKSHGTPAHPGYRSGLAPIKPDTTTLLS